MNMNQSPEAREAQEELAAERMFTRQMQEAQVMAAQAMSEHCRAKATLLNVAALCLMLGTIGGLVALLVRVIL